jgi:3-phenylpropionate/trans-cinnamate dioxygenase ferredoxin reductase subunit
VVSKLNTIAVVGGGLAGVTAALTLRREGFAGRVILIGDEPHPPYNRPALSKDVVRGERDAGKVALRTPAFYEDRNIELRLGTGVAGLEPAAHEIVLDDGARIPYDAVLLATGGRARVLPDVGGARVLRTLGDSVGIRDRLGPGRTLVIVGAGFIGCELAASARTVGTAVSVVEVLPRPLARALPAEVADRIVSIHQQHGVDLRTGFAIGSLDADDDQGRVTAADGTVIAGDTLVVAIGILPETTLAERSGLEVGNGIVVDDRCRTSAPDVYAAGDVANHPNPLLGQRVRIEHWQNAQHQAAAAARNMLGADEAFAEIPWVWSDQYDQHLEMAGIPRPDDEVVVRTNPDPDARDSLAFCLRDGRLVAAIGFNCPKDVTYARRIITAGGTVERAVLADHRIPLAELPGAAAAG